MDHLKSPLLAGYCRPLSTNLHYSLGDAVLFTVNIFINQLLQQYQSNQGKNSCFIRRFQGLEYHNNNF